MIEENQEREYSKISYYRYYYEKGYLKEEEFKKIENQISENPDMCPKLTVKKPLSKKTNVIAIIIGCVLWGIFSVLLQLAGMRLGGIPTAIIIWLCIHFGKSIFQDTVEIQYYDDWQLDDNGLTLSNRKNEDSYTEKEIQKAECSESNNSSDAEEFYVNQSSTADENYKCEICGKPIKIIESVSQNGTIDTDSRKICGDCMAIYNAIASNSLKQISSSIIDKGTEKSETLNTGNDSIKNAVPEGSTKRTDIKENHSSNKKYLIIFSIVFILIVLVLVLIFVLIPSGKYYKAAKCVESENYDSAIALYEELGDYKDSATLINEAYYQKARNLYANDEKLEAALIFGKIHNYKDSWERRCKIIPNPTISAGTFLTAGVKTDGSVIVTQCDNENVIDKGQFEVDNWENIISVSAGYTHTVGLKEDGTVVAVGSNEYGQCDVKNWKDIIAVVAGSYRTLGLKSDGTVVAAGNRVGGGCEVTDWKGVVAIYTGSDQSFGILSNGTIVSTSESVALDWNNIVSIAGVDPFIIGLKSDGTVVTKKPESQRLLKEYDGQCEVTDWTDIVAITMGSSSVGLKSDGTVVITKHTNKDEYIHSYWNVKDWNNIVYITSGGSQLIGLKSDGTVVATKVVTEFSEFFDWEQDDVLEWKNIRLPTK